MFTKFIFSIITIILLISLAGCGATDQSNPSPSEASDKSQVNPASASDTDNYQMLPIISGKMATLKLDASADGTTQKLNTGEILSITLESNPSTGYSWVANISEPAVLALMGEPEYTEPSQSETPLLGAAGTQTFYFQAAESGNATITLDYKRPWETDVAPEQTITIKIEVP